LLTPLDYILASREIPKDPELEFKKKFLNKPEKAIENFEERMKLEVEGIKIFRELRSKHKVMDKIYDFFAYHSTKGLFYQLLSLMNEKERIQLAENAIKVPVILQNCRCDFKWVWKTVLEGKKYLEELTAFETEGLIENIVKNCPKLRVLEIHQVKDSKINEEEFQLLKQLPNLKVLKIHRIDEKISTILTELHLDTLEVTITSSTNIQNILWDLSFCPLKHLIIHDTQQLKMEYFKLTKFKNLECLEITGLLNIKEASIHEIGYSCINVKKLVVNEVTIIENEQDWD
jgi:hypothetical protein